MKKLLFLPLYSPNLNLIERVWKFLKKILKNNYVATFNWFIEKIHSCCDNFNSIFKTDLVKLWIIKFRL